MALLGGFAFTEFRFSGLSRRTFVFYSVAGESVVVEDRMLRRAENREADLGRYVEEVLLGPGSPDLSPLFPPETGLRGILYRNGTVYVNLSESAALPVPGGAFRNFLVLNRGIRRNFSYVKDVRLFVAGNPAYIDEFEGIFPPKF
ncbi:MAG: GerMN domain-containing protein [Treponema sp.]|nr:GerMN domain-containing protein [Treponema sp.]